MKYAHRSTECNDLRIQFSTFCLVRCFRISVQAVQGTERKKLLVDWNEYQENTASIGLHFFLIMLNDIMSALRRKQLQLPTQSTLKKNCWNIKNISFHFHYGKKLVSKGNLQDLIATGVQLEGRGGNFSCSFFRNKCPDYGHLMVKFLI